LWIATSEPTGYPPLERDPEVDVAVVGGGIIGITTRGSAGEGGPEGGAARSRPRGRRCAPGPGEDAARRQVRASRGRARAALL